MLRNRNLVLSQEAVKEKPEEDPTKRKEEDPAKRGDLVKRKEENKSAKPIPQQSSSPYWFSPSCAACLSYETFHDTSRKPLLSSPNYSY